MKYCTNCRKVYPDSITECECQKDRFWKRGEIKSIPAETKIECKDCGSTEDLTYREAWYAGDYKFGDECTCGKCRAEFEARIAREEAMKYFVIDYDNDDFDLYDSKSEVEDMLERMAEDIYSPDDDLSILILKVEKIDRAIEAKDFLPPKNTNIIFFGYEFYRVEEVIEPEVEFDGDCHITW